jgi:hypothetical protein
MKEHPAKQVQKPTKKNWLCCCVPIILAITSWNHCALVIQIPHCFKQINMPSVLVIYKSVPLLGWHVISSFESEFVLSVRCHMRSKKLEETALLNEWGWGGCLKQPLHRDHFLIFCASPIKACFFFFFFLITVQPFFLLMSLKCTLNFVYFSVRAWTCMCVCVCVEYTQSENWYYLGSEGVEWRVLWVVSNFLQVLRLSRQYHSIVVFHAHISSGGWIICPVVAAVQRHSLTP